MAEQSGHTGLGLVVGKSADLDECVPLDPSVDAKGGLFLDSIIPHQ